jgi:D-alanine transaminase
MPRCWVNGTTLDEAHATVSIFDRGLLFGDGVYEVAAVYNGRLLDADLHLRRLEKSLAAIRLTVDLDATPLLSIMQQVASENAIREGLVYLQITRGAAERDFAFPAQATPTVIVWARSKSLDTAAHHTGIALHVVPDLRWARRDIKSVAMLAQVLAKQAAKEAGAQEALMHFAGEVTEGGSSNVWMVTGGVARTRPLSHDILAGITRDVVVKLTRELGIPLDETAFTLDDAYTADELFITSATSFVMPVASVDGRAIGSGSPGPVTVRLRDAYLARAARCTA